MNNKKTLTKIYVDAIMKGYEPDEEDKAVIAHMAHKGWKRNSRTKHSAAKLGPKSSEELAESLIAFFVKKRGDTI